MQNKGRNRVKWVKYSHVFLLNHVKNQTQKKIHPRTVTGMDLIFIDASILLFRVV